MQSGVASRLQTGILLSSKVLLACVVLHRNNKIHVAVVDDQYEISRR